MQTKVCTKCGIIKNIELFSKAKTGQFGRRGECKECQSGKNKEYRKNSSVREREILSKKEYRKNRVVVIPENAKLCCTKCNTIKSIEEFNKCYFGKYGRKSICKSCQKVIKKEYYSKPEVKKRCIEYSKEYKKIHSDKMIQYKREYQKDWIKKPKNKEKYDKWRNDNKDMLLKLSREWYEQNKEKINSNRKEDRKEATNNYIRHLISASFKITKNELGLLPEDIIESKRLILIMKRELKKIKNEN